MTELDEKITMSVNYVLPSPRSQVQVQPNEMLILKLYYRYYLQHCYTKVYCVYRTCYKRKYCRTVVSFSAIEQTFAFWPVSLKYYNYDVLFSTMLFHVFHVRTASHPHSLDHCYEVNEVKYLLSYSPEVM